MKIFKTKDHKHHVKDDKRVKDADTFTKMEKHVKMDPQVNASPTSGTAQYKTRIAYRLHHEITNATKTTGRSQEVVPLSQEYEKLRKQLQSVIAVARHYRTTVDAMAESRRNLFNVMAVLAKDSPLAEIVGTNVEGNTGDTLASLQEDFYRTDHEHSAAYQLAVVDYAEEWETLVAKRIEPEIRLSSKLHKVLQHYESKVGKLREHVHDQEAHDKAPQVKESNKLERNEKKLSDAWTEHDKTATRTSNLIESATKSRWKDLYPLLQAMTLCEQGRELDQHDLWERASLIQGKLDSIATQYDNPLAEGAKDAPPPASGKVEQADPTEPHSDVSGDEY